MKMNSKLTGTLTWYNTATAAAKTVIGQEWLAYDECAYNDQAFDVVLDVPETALLMEILGCLLETGTFTMAGNGNFDSAILYTGEYSANDVKKTTNILLEALPGLLVSTTTSTNGYHTKHTLSWQDLETWKLETFNRTVSQGCDTCAEDTTNATCQYCYEVWQEHLHGQYINLLELAVAILGKAAQQISINHHQSHLYEYIEELENMVDQYRKAMCSEAVSTLDYLDLTRNQYAGIVAHRHRVQLADYYADYCQDQN
jgi:hypothetical protein